jgi:formiminotetrahydrofolate cyclodeaminase
VRAGARRAEALALAQQDLRAYEPVLRATRLPAGDPERAGRIAAALSEAAEPPLAVARAAAELAELAAAAARGGSRQLAGDARAGLALAEGACRAAVGLVRANLAAAPGDARLAELDALTARAEAARGADAA